MSRAKKAFLCSLCFHILIFVMAFFINFEQEKPIEFIEVEFAQALPFSQSPENEPQGNKEEASEIAPPQKIEKTTTPDSPITPPQKDVETQIKNNETPISSENIEKIIEPDDPITPPKRNLVANNDDDKIFMPKKKQPSPTENFDDLLSLDKPEIKGAEISEYQLDKPLEQNQDSLPPLPDLSLIKDKIGEPSGSKIDDEGKNKADINLSIEGELLNRKIITRPDIDPASVNKAGTIKIKIIVSPEGHIEQTIPLQRGEYLEKLAMDNLRKWRFEKLSSDKDQRNQSGIVTFIFLLD